MANVTNQVSKTKRKWSPSLAFIMLLIFKTTLPLLKLHYESALLIEKLRQKRTISGPHSQNKSSAKQRPGTPALTAWHLIPAGLS